MHPFLHAGGGYEATSFYANFYSKTALSKYFMNKELDNYPANFVYQKAAAPPSTNPGSATDTV